MAEEHPNAEAHFIGSLIDSLTNANEDEVFFASSTPNSSFPLPDASSDQFLKSDSTVSAMHSSYGGQPDQMHVRLLQQLQQNPPQPFWATANSTMPIQERPPLPRPLPPSLLASVYGHGRWIPSPSNFVQPPPGFSSMDVYQQQQYQAFLAHQQRQQALDFSAIQNANLMGLLQSNDPRHRGQSQNQERPSFQGEIPTADQNNLQAHFNDQWESIYTPFGPVRGPAGFDAATNLRLAAQGIAALENSSSVGPLLREHSQYTLEPDSSVDFESKRRSASVSSPVHALSKPEAASYENTISSSSSGLVTNSCSTAASSPSLPPKGRSYRDVAKTKTESKLAGSRGKKLLSPAVVGGSQGVSSKESESGQLSNEMQQLAVDSPSRKFSAPVRESSSDSISEFGGSENGASGPTTMDEISTMENFVAGFLDKHPDSTDGKRQGQGAKLSDQNILKKNAMTTTLPTQSGDFRQISRRKTSQSKLLQGRDPSPVLGAESRYAVLSKKSPVKSNAATTGGGSGVSSVELNSPFKERQQQTIKLNNEEAAIRFASKSPTRKAAYINNDLSWPSKPKSTNWKNESGDWSDDVDVQFVGRKSDNSHGRLADEDEQLDQDELDGSEEEAGSGNFDGRRSDRKGEADSDLKNRKKLVGGSVPAQKFGAKKGKSKRGDGGDAANRKRRQQRCAIVCWINVILTVIGIHIRDAAFWLINLITDIGHQLWEITFYFSKSSCIKISTSAQYAWHSTAERLRKVILCIRQKEWSILLWWRARRKNRNGDSDYLGLEENIELPNTGEEALRRLLSCRGQDAYSILGLRPDCTDDEVKCYYRRQAILVHPDKNPCYGSDEAFKILAAAFELIGTPERRRAYDLQNLHKTKAMHDLQGMLTKLKEKMEEIRSTMQCDCGGKHKRFPTERELAYARYCRKCGEKHHAREGDIWAESHWFGFLWYYYACMDGVVFDITEWAGCQKNNLKHMKPDTHLVQYRLITGRNTRQFNQQQQPTGFSSAYSQQQYGGPQQFNRQTSDHVGSNNADDDLWDQYWEERLSASRNTPSMTPSVYLPQGSAIGASTSSTNFGNLGGMDFSAPAQSKFNPPTCPSHGDSRPRKAGRRRKARM